jgi:hypothetical protein
METTATDYHRDPVEAQVCPLCHGVDSPGISGEAMRRAHQVQEFAWHLARLFPTELLEAELNRRHITEAR